MFSTTAFHLKQRLFLLFCSILFIIVYKEKSIQQIAFLPSILREQNIKRIKHDKRREKQENQNDQLCNVIYCIIEFRSCIGCNFFFWLGIHEGNHGVPSITTL